VRFQFEGLEELKEALRNLPAELAGEASRIVEGAANGIIVDMRAEYPPGELRDRLYQSSLSSGPFGVGVLIKNTSPAARLWDNGTVLRHTSGGQRAGHPTGAEWGGRAEGPPFTFKRNMVKGRYRMLVQFKALLERAGLLVEWDGA
jgi:hypothetical protein